MSQLLIPLLIAHISTWIDTMTSMNTVFACIPLLIWNAYPCFLYYSTFHHWDMILNTYNLTGGSQFQGIQSMVGWPIGKKIMAEVGSGEKMFISWQPRNRMGKSGEEQVKYCTQSPRPHIHDLSRLTQKCVPPVSLAGSQCQPSQQHEACCRSSHHRVIDSS